MALHIEASGENGRRAKDHETGPVEIGRGPQRGAVARLILDDPYISRDQLRMQQLLDGSVYLENLSQSVAIAMADGRTVAPGEHLAIEPPFRLRTGQTEVSVTRAGASAAAPSAAPEPTLAAPAMPAQAAETTIPGDQPSGPDIRTVPRPAALSERPVALQELGEAPNAETLAHWFETLVHVQQAAASSEEFLEATTRALVDLVGMDRGLVLLREEASWRPVAVFPARGALRFSTTIVNEVLRLRQTVYRNFGTEFTSLSLVGVDTVVAAPIFDSANRVTGIVYGARSIRPDSPPPPVVPLEALVVQVLAAAVGAGLERELQREKALRSQVQFEQFFSPQLARELAADSSLLEGREREVTVLFTDVRNFSRISEHLGPQRTFQMMQEVMELQSVHIRETDGVVVDYVGDGLLAMWNAPGEQPDHPRRACTAAAAFLGQLPALSARWEAEAGEPIRLGAGIHTGMALVGNTGSHVKFKYGPMGPTVNLASRLENATKALGVTPLLSRATRDRLPPGFGTRRLGSIRVQGMADAVDVFELQTATVTPEWAKWRDEYEEALAHFEQKDWARACQELVGLIHPEGFDIPSLQLLSRAVECLRSQPDVFDPAIVIQKQA